MNPNQQSSNEMPDNGMIGNVSESTSRKSGLMVAIIVIVLVLVVAALYLFASNMGSGAPTQETVMTASDYEGLSSGQSVQPVTNMADDVQSLQNDLNAATQGLDGQNF